MSDLRICEEQGLLHAGPVVHLQEFRRREQAIGTTAQAKRNQQSFAFGEVMCKKGNFLDGASAAAGNCVLDLRNHSEQMNRSPAASTLPLAHEPRDLWTRLALEKEYPRSRRCSDQATKVEPCGLRAVFRFFLQSECSAPSRVAQHASLLLRCHFK